MFHFPAFPPPPYTRSDDGGPAQPGPGSPIRTPPDQSSLANSPGHIAGRNVLHQLLVPRHPPNAPQNHTTKNTPTRPAPTQKKRGNRARGPRAPHRPANRQDTTKMKRGDARRQQRCSQPLYKSQTTHHQHHTTPTRGTAQHRGRTPEHAPPQRGRRTGVGSEPDSAPARPQHIKPHAQPRQRGRAPPAQHQRNTRAPKHHHATGPHPPNKGKNSEDRRPAAPQQGSLERR